MKLIEEKARKIPRAWISNSAQSLSFLAFHASESGRSRQLLWGIQSMEIDDR